MTIARSPTRSWPAGFGAWPMACSGSAWGAATGWNVVNFLTCADFRSDDVTLAVAPFFWVGGTGVNVLPVLFMGGRWWRQAT